MNLCFCYFVFKKFNQKRSPQCLMFWRMLNPALTGIRTHCLPSRSPTAIHHTSIHQKNVGSKIWDTWGGGIAHSAFALLTQQPWVWFSVFPKKLMLLRLIDSELLREWTEQSLIVDQTHLVLVKWQASTTKRKIWATSRPAVGFLLSWKVKAKKLITHFPALLWPSLALSCCCCCCYCYCCCCCYWCCCCCCCYCCCCCTLGSNSKRASLSSLFLPRVWVSLCLSASDSSIYFSRKKSG